MGRNNIVETTCSFILTKMVDIVTIIVCQYSGRFVLVGFNCIYQEK
jgi:hypothetical protein